MRCPSCEEGPLIDVGIEGIYALKCPVCGHVVIHEDGLENKHPDTGWSVRWTIHDSMDEWDSFDFFL